jgi:hypothetical protein
MNKSKNYKLFKKTSNSFHELIFPPSASMSLFPKVYQILKFQEISIKFLSNSNPRSLLEF